MNLIKANINDFDKLTQFYRDAILNTDNMEIYAKWIYGKHPTDAMILRYIEAGAMFFCEKDGLIASAVAVTPCQSVDYHNIDWKIQLSDDEAAVVHILCVNPCLQKQGIAKMTMRLVIELCRGENKKAVRLDALSCNSPAHRLYEGLGFEKRGQQRWFTDNVGWTDFFLYEFIL